MVLGDCQCLLPQLSSPTCAYTSAWLLKAILVPTPYLVVSAPDLPSSNSFPRHEPTGHCSTPTIQFPSAPCKSIRHLPQQAAGWFESFVQHRWSLGFPAEWTCASQKASGLEKIQRSVGILLPQGATWPNWMHLCDYLFSDATNEWDHMIISV